MTANNDPQRGTDPSTVRRDPAVAKSPVYDPSYQARRARIKPRLDRLVKEKGLIRQNGLWPYLLIRAMLGDQGIRPLHGPGGAPATVLLRPSPDILVVPVPASGQPDPGHATINPQPGHPHAVFVRVWNLGRMAAFGVNLSVFQTHPGETYDAQHPPQLLGSTYLDLPDYRDPNCFQLVRISQTWTPPGPGFHGLLAKVTCFADMASPGFDPVADRHIARFAPIDPGFSRP